MKKFTEEQYQQIVDAWDAKGLYVEATGAVIELMNSFDESWNFDGDQALALANPATREWAHERVVEKEKRYVWTSK